MYCKQCGFILDINDNSCPNCGTSKGMGQGFCPQCGSPVQNSQNNFCPTCGFRFSSPLTDGNAPMQTIKHTASGQGFDLKTYMGEYVGNVQSTVQMPDKLKLGLRYGACAVSVLTFLFMLMPIISVDVTLFDYKEGRNIFAVSPFGGFMFFLALLASAALFLPHVQSFIRNNKKLEPFVYLIVPLLELLGMLSMLIGVGVTGSYIQKLSLGLATAHLGFCGWLILILCIAGIGSAIYSFIKYDLASVKADNPFVTAPPAPTKKDSITDAMNGDTYQNTVYYGNDTDNNRH